MKKLLLLSFVLLCVGAVNAQDFLGYNYSNYQTVGGMVFNPASIAGSRYSVNVNIFSFNLGAINNGYELRKKSIFDGNLDNMEEGVDFFKIDNSAKKNMFFNVDMLGPSFMVDLGPKAGAFGVSSRVRFIVNEKNLDNDIFQLFGDANANYFGVPYTQDNLMVDAHGFADIGLTYARVIWQNEQHTVKGGFTGKYVIGIAGGSARINNLNVEVDEELSTDMIRTLQGNMTMLYSAGLDKVAGDFEAGDLLDYAEKSGNFGMDLGLEYEWYREGARSVPAPDRDSWLENCRTRYLLKASVSVTDIGKVKYSASKNATNYTINNLAADYPVSDLDLDDRSLDEYLDYLQSKGIITETSMPHDYKVNLPTTLRMNVDWNMYKRLFVNAGATVSLLGKGYGGRYSNYYYMTPRYESKWFSVYSPIAYNSLKQVSWGIGFNVGPFFVGSGSVLSNLVSDNIKGADIHIGFSIPIFKKKPSSKAVKPEPEMTPVICHYPQPVIAETSRLDSLKQVEEKLPAVGEIVVVERPVKDTMPEIQEEVVQKVNLAAQQIFFASGSDQLLLKSYFALDELAALLQEHSTVKVDIEGHTDNTGNAKANQVLSEKRAQAVKKYLASKGVAGDRMTAIGYGQTQPIVDNNTTEGRSKNRRVEIKMHY